METIACGGVTTELLVIVEKSDFVPETSILPCLFLGEGVFWCLQEWWHWLDAWGMCRLG